MVQQSARLSADDEPLAAAKIAKQQIFSGQSIEDIIPQQETDLRDNAGVFLIITDNNQKVLGSSAVLDDEAPLPPRGVFVHTRENGRDSFTWEPKTGVRYATQMLKFDQNGGGYIIAGKSLKSVEDRVSKYNLIAFLAWLAVILWTTILIFPVTAKLLSKRRSKSTKSA